MDARHIMPDRLRSLTRYRGYSISSGWMLTTGGTRSYRIHLGICPVLDATHYEMEDLNVLSE